MKRCDAILLKVFLYGLPLLSSSHSGMPENAIEDIFTYSGLPLSGSALILLLILWQVGCYNFSMRRLTR